MACTIAVTDDCQFLYILNHNFGQPVLLAPADTSSLAFFI